MPTITRSTDSTSTRRETDGRTNPRMLLRDTGASRPGAAITIGSLYGFGGISCLLVSRYPMSPGLAIGLSQIFGIVGIAVALLLIGLRKHVTIVILNAALAAATVAVSVLVGNTSTAVGVMLPSVFYMCIALTAAYFFPPTQARAYAAMTAGGFTIGVLASGVTNLIVPWLIVTISLLSAAELLRHTVAELRQCAALDPLTGIANRAYFRLVAERELTLASRGGPQFSIALLDLDDFKAVNDTFGHIAGDTLLTELATAWQVGLRRSDLLARYGGDEFAVVMPATSYDEAVRVLDRLRAAHRAAWSAGVATWDDETTLNSLLQRADDELYRAKSSRAG